MFVLPGFAGLTVIARRSARSTAFFIVSFPAGSHAPAFLGLMLDRSWGSYFYFMAPFGIVGGLLMMSIIGKITLTPPAR